ncbi:MAG: efflux RND transporter periplasmic adaptor subunit [Rhizobium sp.]|nr:efflux RND transporter periplasmic adaptor subunit [Rhizobium sp.]
MKRSVKSGLLLAALLAAGTGGYWAGQHGLVLSTHSRFVSMKVPEQGKAAPTGSILYYRDPDGPFYSSSPKQNAKGRAFLPVFASEEISFDPLPVKAEAGNAAKTPGKIRFYRNPMGLPDTSPVPKKDSMGMDYIPVYEGDEDESGIVKISPGKVQRTGVRSVAAARQRIAQMLRAPGIVALDERLITVLSARVDTFVEKVASVTTGEAVTKNQPLVTLFSTEIAAAAAQFITELTTDARGANAQGISAGGARKRLENLGVPPEEIAEIERSRKVPANMVWRAPRNGILIERNVVEGMKMAAGTTLFRIADATKLWVLADVPELGLASLRPGAEAMVRVRHRPDLTFSGKISLIYPQVNVETRTARIRIEIANPDLALLPNMFVNVEIAAGDNAERVAVPESAVIDSGTRKIVLIDRDEGRFEPREVKTGPRGNGFVAILDGVEEGDRVVTSANFLIDAESNLKAALQSLTMANEMNKPEKANMEKQP